jgi:hypothetical protein
MAAAANRAVAKTDNLPPPLVTRDQLVADSFHLIVEVAELENEHRDLPIVAEDDDDLKLITATATSTIKLGKRIEESRTDQNRPFLDASALLNDFYKRELGGILTTLKSNLESVSTSYQRKKAIREQALRDQQAATARKLVDEAASKVTAAVKAGDVKTATAAVTEANSLTAFANKASAAAAAPVNSMARITTDAGSASLVDNWTFDELDVNTVDLEVLRAFIPQAAIEQALRQFIKSGRREIKGARIYNDNKTRFRG